MDPEVSALEQQYGIPPGLYAAILTNGENSGADAVSSKGAVGRAQLMPSTAAAMGVDPTDPQQNLVGGARYVGQLYSKYRDPALTAAAYNAGPGAVDAHGGVPPYPETTAYVGRVMNGYQAMPSDDALSQSYANSPPTAAASQAAPTGMPYDASLGIQRNQDGSIKALPGGISVETKDASGNWVSGSSLISDPAVIRRFLDNHPEDIANHLGMPSDDDLQKSFDAASSGQARPSPQAAPASGGDAVGDKSMLGAVAPDLDAALTHFMDSATGGFATKLRAGIDALPAFLKSGPDAGAQQYSANLTGLQGQLAGQGASYPAASTVGGVGGLLGQAVLLPEAPAAGLAARIGVGALQGGALAGADAIGHARGGPIQEAETAIVPTILGAGLGGTLHGVLGPKPALPASSAPAATAADYASAGVDPSLAVNGGPGVQQIGQILKGVPFVGAPMHALASRTLGQVDQAATNAASSLGAAANPEAAGAALQQGARDSVASMLKTKAQLYGPVNALAENKTPIVAANTLATTQKMLGEFPNTEALFRQQAPEVARLHDALTARGGRVTFAELKALRSNVGKLSRDHSIVGDVDKGRLKALYGAMSSDMEAGAEQLGGKRALADMKAANAHNARMHQVIDETLNRVMGKDSTGAMIPKEIAFARVLSAARTGGRADVEQLQQLRAALPEQAWREVGAGIVHGLGRKDGAFSVAKFATDWAGLTPSAKAALFPRETVDSLDSISRIANTIQKAGRFYNHSQSGNHLLVGMFLGEPAEAAIGHVMHGNLGALVASVAAPAGLAVGGRTLSHLLASPGFARLVLNAGKAAKAPAMVDRMFAKYAADNPDMTSEVDQFRAMVMRRLLTNAPTTVSVGTLDRPRARAPETVRP